MGYMMDTFGAGGANARKTYGVKTPWRRRVGSPRLCGMKNNSKKKYRTFGEFIEGVYNVCGKRKAAGIVRLAMESHLIEFRKGK